MMWGRGLSKSMRVGVATGSFLMLTLPSGSLELRLKLDDVKAVLITAGTGSLTGTSLLLSVMTLTLGSALLFFFGVPLLGETESVTTASLAWAVEGSFFCFTRS